jgi:hypothetical protein
MYGFKENLGYFVADNATNNDTCLLAIEQELEKQDIYFIAVYRRTRCIGYNFNLIARALLFREDLDAVEIELTRSNLDTNNELLT